LTQLKVSEIDPVSEPEQQTGQCDGGSDSFNQNIAPNPAFEPDEDVSDFRRSDVHKEDPARWGGGIRGQDSGVSELLFL